MKNIWLIIVLIHSRLFKVWINRQIVIQFVRRDVASRYRGSVLGIVWSFVVPLIMLSIYTFVFSFVFKARWNINSSNKMEFALILFCGVITFNVFGEVVGRAPTVITSNANLVKKVVFPLGILPVSLIGSSLINFVIGLAILLAGDVAFLGVPHWSILFLPLIMIPLTLVSLGISWFLGSLGVYFRDISQLTGLVVQALMFLTPIFYPVSAVPVGLRGIYELNPLAVFVGMMRNAIIWGVYPNVMSLGIWIIISYIIALLGFIWFERTKRGFADVV